MRPGQYFTDMYVGLRDRWAWISSWYLNWKLPFLSYFNCVPGDRRQDDLHGSHGGGGGRGVAPPARVPLRLRRRRPEAHDLGHPLIHPQQGRKTNRTDQAWNFKCRVERESYTYYFVKWTLRILRVMSHPFHIDPQSLYPYQTYELKLSMFISIQSINSFWSLVLLVRSA